MTIREKYAEQIKAAEGFDGIPDYILNMTHEETKQAIKQEKERLDKLYEQILKKRAKGKNGSEQ